MALDRRSCPPRTAAQDAALLEGAFDLQGTRQQCVVYQAQRFSVRGCTTAGYPHGGVSLALTREGVCDQVSSAALLPSHHISSSRATSPGEAAAGEQLRVPLRGGHWRCGGQRVHTGGGLHRIREQVRSVSVHRAWKGAEIRNWWAQTVCAQYPCKLQFSRPRCQPAGMQGVSVRAPSLCMQLVPREGELPVRDSVLASYLSLPADHASYNQLCALVHGEFKPLFY